MTTIAYKAGVLASDSLITANGARDSSGIKIRRIGKMLVAGAGSTAIWERYVDWVKNGLKGDSPWYEREDGNGLLVANGCVLLFGSKGPTRITADCYALGSGCNFALGAMAHGASAEEAVRAAIQFDIYSGGDIRTVSL